MAVGLLRAAIKVAAFLFLGALVLADGEFAPPVGAGLAEVDRAPRSLPVGRPIRWAYYYPPDPSSLESLRANASRLDVVAPHWLRVDEEGRLQGDLPSEARTLLRRVDAVVLPSVALASRESGARIVTDGLVAAAVIEQLVSVAEAWDGLALDFEGLDPSARDSLSEFIQSLGGAVRGAGRVFAVAVPAKTSDVRTGWSGAYDLAAIANAADAFLVMAYGFRSSASAEPGSTAPLPWVDAAMSYTASVIPPDRLILGVAFYGYDWNLAKGPPARALRYADTARLLERVGAVPTLDPRSLSATFSYEDDEGESHEVWFEDARSLDAKLRLVETYGLRGAGAWRLGQEDPRAWLAWDHLLGGP